jgi:hypothetical protein
VTLARVEGDRGRPWRSGTPNRRGSSLVLTRKNSARPVSKLLRTALSSDREPLRIAQLERDALDLDDLPEYRVIVARCWSMASVATTR